MSPATDDGYGVPDRHLFFASVIQYGNLWQYLSSMHLEIYADIVLVEAMDLRLLAVPLSRSECAPGFIPEITGAKGVYL